LEIKLAHTQPVISVSNPPTYAAEADCQRATLTMKALWELVLPGVAWNQARFEAFSRKKITLRETDANPGPF
jgi:hypothetical protein